jgi:glutamate formiminotransferase/formiminotetrahydrofolate cyclodeaminase
MSRPVLECVPNFSEGVSTETIQAIARSIEAVDGVKLLDVDPGRSTNRTVYTFAGEPEAVVEAAFQAARVGTSLIDMRKHKGEHPRFGALDVCPFIPIAGLTMDEAVRLARGLARRLGEELGLTIFLYGHAAQVEGRSDLSDIRAGEYEGLEQKLCQDGWAPDYGPRNFNPGSGASAVGARDLLIAYNVNLNTTSVRRANSVAFDIRERGRIKRIGDPLTGEVVRGPDGTPEYEPGELKSVKAIGWFIEEFGFAQVSMNLTDLRESPLHKAFDVACEKAGERGIRVTGSELVGLVPLATMLDAGRYFLKKQKRSSGVSDDELIRIAVLSMGLSELGTFEARKKIIEYAIQDFSKTLLVDMPVRRFVEETASESPAPGGGSIAATMGAMGAALGTMVANLSSHKRGWDDRWEEFSGWAERGKAIYTELLRLIDEDTEAFNGIMSAFALPKVTEDEKSTRSTAIQAATKHAVEIPLKVMAKAAEAFDVLEAMAKSGNPNSVSDAGVGALAARSAVLGAELNVRINCGSLEDAEYVKGALMRASELSGRATNRERDILEIVNRVMAAATI